MVFEPNFDRFSCGDCKIGSVVSHLFNNSAYYNQSIFGLSFKLRL